LRTWGIRSVSSVRPLGRVCLTIMVDSGNAGGGLPGEAPANRPNETAERNTLRPGLQPPAPGAVLNSARTRPPEPMSQDDAAYRRYVQINLPHARTVAARVGRSLEALGAFGEAANGGALGLRAAYEALEQALAGFEEDPPFEAALSAADAAAVRGRALVQAILATPFRGERLGQQVRNLFECLGLSEGGRPGTSVATAPIHPCAEASASAAKACRSWIQSQAAPETSSAATPQTHSRPAPLWE